MTTDQPGDARAVATDDSWKPAVLREAEARLDETVERSRELEQEVDQLELPQQPPVASPEDVAAFKAEADRADAPEEMRILKRKVDAGELSWKDVLESRAYQDEDVRNALTARLGPLTDVYQDFEDGHTLDDVLEAAGETGPLSGTRAIPFRHRPLSSPRRTTLAATRLWRIRVDHPRPRQRSRRPDHPHRRAHRLSGDGRATTSPRTTTTSAAPRSVSDRPATTGPATRGRPEATCRLRLSVRQRP